MKYQTKGFTLIELMVVMAIVAIVAVYGVPMLSDTMSQRRVDDTAFNLKQDIRLARSLALSKSTVVELKPVLAMSEPNWNIINDDISSTSDNTGDGEIAMNADDVGVLNSSHATWFVQAKEAPEYKLHRLQAVNDDVQINFIKQTDGSAWESPQIDKIRFNADGTLDPIPSDFAIQIQSTGNENVSAKRLLILPSGDVQILTIAR